MNQEAPRQAGYDGFSKLLHWLTVLFLVVQFIFAWQMPHIGRNTVLTTLINFHFSFGAVIMALVAIRLVWAFLRPARTPRDIPKWQDRLSSLVHGLIYLLLLVIPPMGWANMSGRGWTVKMWGLFDLPSIAPVGNRIAAALGDLHVNLTWVLLTLAGIHVVAALYHHFVRRDRILLRMLPFVSR